jgi:hypothetical protein
MKFCFQTSVIYMYLAWYKHDEILTFFHKHLRCTRFNITQKSANKAICYRGIPNEFTESHSCPLSRAIINKSHPASAHLSKTAFRIILQLCHKMTLRLWYTLLVFSLVRFHYFRVIHTETVSFITRGLEISS